MEKIKVVILGGGAVGSVIASALSESAKIDLKLIGRKEHILQINHQGLKIMGKIKGTYLINSLETIDFSLADSLLIPAVKATQLQNSLISIFKYIKNSTAILIINNGIQIRAEVKNILKNKLLPKNLFRGIINFGSTFTNPGEINYWGGKITLEKRFKYSQYQGIFNNSFLNYTYSNRMEYDVWKKLLINCIYNPLSVILNISNNHISLPDFDSIKQLIMDECKKVALSEGINISIDLERLNKNLSSKNITSMLQDILKNKGTEIDYLNGKISVIGKRNGIRTPVNDFIVDLIKAIEYIRHNQLTILPDQG